MKSIEFNGRSLPFYRTMRGMVDFSNSIFSLEQLMAGDIAAIMYSAYVTLRGACKRDGVKFEYTFDEFVDAAPVDFLEKINALENSEEVADEQKKK